MKTNSTFLKIGIDISKMQALSRSRGIGFYTKYLFESLKKYTSVDVTLIEDEDNHAQFDLIHYPYFDFFKPTLPLIKKYPTVVTIHDVTPLVFPQYYPSGIKGRLNLERQKLALKGVKAVITDSVFSKKDVVKYLNIEEKKVFPIYLGSAQHFKPLKDFRRLKKVKEKYNLPEKFVLYVGNVNWNKNIVNLTQACLEIGIDLFLVGGGFNQENLNHSELKPLKDFRQKFSGNPLIHVVNFVEDQELVALYNLATCLLMPSFYEGFGLPILEAQACGCLVITSNVSSMPEVAGSGALFVDPYDTDDIAQKLKKILNDEKLKQDLINKGFENIKRFSWEKTAIATAKIYESIK